MNQLNPFSTTLLGSFPFHETQALCQQLVAEIDIPAWPQLPRRTFLENMYTQFSAPLPGIVTDYQREKVYFDTTQDLTPHLEIFYEHYLADDLDYFSLPPKYAVGFYEMLPALQSAPGLWVKGQVTGPVSFGLTVTDQELHASLYHELLIDPILKNICMNARWQIQQLKHTRKNVIIFVDEPYLASFGSAYINLNRDQVTELLEEVFEVIHQEGVLSGIHCCGNTDWSMLLETSVDVLNLDAYDYLESLALYPQELHDFLSRGGWICWGLVPNNPMLYQETAPSLEKRLKMGFSLILEKAHRRGVPLELNEIAQRSLIAPNCGLGSASTEIAQRALELLPEVANLFKTTQ
jgi:methionine synthase II (cobalamin-independent)